MLQFKDIVSILHSGGTEEVDFIEYLENSLAKNNALYILDYTKYQQHQAKDVIMLTDAKKYKAQNIPMIVLISRFFFDLIFPTTCKQGILNAIVLSKNCLHIWLDVTEDDVKRYSKALLRTNGPFRRISASELRAKSDPVDMVKKIHSLIMYGNAHGDANILNNYAVDDEVDEMRTNFLRLHASTTIETLQSSIPTEHNRKQAVKKKPDVYKDVLRIASMSIYDQELAVYNRDIVYHNETIIQNTQQPKKKKKPGDIKLVNDISANDVLQICIYLDQGPGANWKQLAEHLKLNADIISNLSKQPHKNSSPSEQMFSFLKLDRPELEISDLMLACKRIIRRDVLSILQNISLNHTA